MLCVAIEVEWLKAIAVQGYHCCREGAVHPCKEVQKKSGLLMLCCTVLLRGGGLLAGAAESGFGSPECWLAEGLTVRGRWYLLAEVALRVRSRLYVAGAVSS